MSTATRSARPARSSCWTSTACPRSPPPRCRLHKRQPDDVYSHDADHTISNCLAKAHLAVLLPLLSFVPVRLLRRAHNGLLGGFQFRRRVLDLQQLLDVLLHLSLRRVALDHVLQRLVLRLAAVDERCLAISRVCLDAVLQVLC